MSRPIATATMLALALTLGACGRDESYVDTASAAGAVIDTTLPAPIPAPAGPTVTIAVAENNGATILTDAAGHALYIADKAPNCTDASCDGFLPLKGTAASGAPAVKGELIGTTTLPDGSTQITYAQQPLFTYSEDMAAGDTKGQGKRANSATYTLVNPEGTSVSAKKSKS